MRKNEICRFLTREMEAMLQDESLTKEQRFDILAAVMFDAPIKNSVLGSFAKSLKVGFERINEDHHNSVMKNRNKAKKYSQITRDAKKILETTVNDNQLTATDGNGRQSTTTLGLKTKRLKTKGLNTISPYKPPKGGGEKEKENFDSSSSPHAEDKGAPSEPTMDELIEDFRAGDEVLTDEVCKAMAKEIEKTEAFHQMIVDSKKLERVLKPLYEKNSSRLDKWYHEVMDGLAAWTEWWKADDWKYKPGRITTWLRDKKYIEPPRKKQAAEKIISNGCEDTHIDFA